MPLRDDSKMTNCTSYYQNEGKLHQLIMNEAELNDPSKKLTAMDRWYRGSVSAEKILKLVEEAELEWCEIGKYENIRKETGIPIELGSRASNEELFAVSQYYSRKRQEWFSKWFGC